jgi:glycosyltransferase involved in cell wall biosynthesis
VTSLVVLHVSGNRFPPLPADHHTLAIWRELARCAADYHVFARSSCGRGSDTREGNIHLHLVPSVLVREAESLVSSLALLLLVRRIRPSVILCQCPVFGGLAATIASRLYRIPMMVELHGEHFFRDRQHTLRARVFQLLARPALGAARTVRVLSPDMQLSLRATYGHEVASKSVVIPTRVDLALFSPVKDDYRLQGDIRLVTVGSFAPVKNHLALIHAIRGLQRVRLTLVGAGPLRASYESVIANYGLRDRVTLHPWVAQRELAQILGSHDAYVHYSVTEALPRAILEAMAMGLPVVATNVGFVSTLLHNDVNALLLDAPWDEHLASAIARLTASESLRRLLGRAGAETVRKDFEWNAAFDRYRAAIVATSKQRVALRPS